MKENIILCFITLSVTVSIHTIVILFKTTLRTDQNTHFFFSFNLAKSFNIYLGTYIVIQLTFTE